MHLPEDTSQDVDTLELEALAHEMKYLLRASGTTAIGAHSKA